MIRLTLLVLFGVALTHGRRVSFLDVDLFKYCCSHHAELFRAHCIDPNWRDRTVKGVNDAYVEKIGNRRITDVLPNLSLSNACYWTWFAGMVTPHGSAFFCPNVNPIVKQYPFSMIPPNTTTARYVNDFTQATYYCENGSKWEDVPMFYWQNRSHVIIANYANLTQFSDRCVINVRYSPTRVDVMTLESYFKRRIGANRWLHRMGLIASLTCLCVVLVLYLCMV